MKRNLIKTIAKIFGLLVVCSLFASFSPSLDGRAVVANEGVFPEGLFAKTVGYLPGDELSVTNIAGNETIQILVIGALDPSEGVAILLSPEAARAIGIEKNSNNIVKITKRAGQDERAFGTAIITKTNEPEVSPAPIAKAEKTESIPAPIEEIVPTLAEESEFAEESDFEEEAEVSEELELNEVPFDVDGAEYTEEEFIAEFPAENDMEEEDEFILIEDDEDFEPFAETEEEFVDEEIPEEEIPEKEILEEEIAEEEIPEEDFIEEEIPEEEIPIDEIPEEEELPIEELVEEEFPIGEPEEFYEEESPEGAVEEIFPAEEEIEESLPFEDDEYDAIVLVPAEDNPPEVPYEEEIVVDSRFEDVPEVEDVVEDFNESIFIPAIEEESASTGSTGFDKYIVKSFDDLQKGAYYIQIAVMRDEANITDIISKYGKNYPIVIIPKADGKGNYILIGPLNVDEYGAVLARFKAYGYKDAFLRKIK